MIRDRDIPALVMVGIGLLFLVALTILLLAGRLHDDGCQPTPTTTDTATPYREQPC